jgi:hypothetical protein
MYGKTAGAAPDIKLSAADALDEGAKRARQ